MSLGSVTSKRTFLLAAFFTVGLTGCSCGPTPLPPLPDDGGASQDAGAIDSGSELDGGPDAGAADAGTVDAGTPDAGAADAGAVDSGSAPDAGPADAGSAVDGGAPDAGPADAGSAVDGGTPDAGPADAGCWGLPTADGGCAPLAYSGLCALTRFTVLLDGNADDDDSGLRMAAALHAACNGGPTLRAVYQLDGGAIASDGRPLVGPDELLVCGGGSFLQDHVGWLEQRDVLQVRDLPTWPVSAGWALRDGGVLVSVPLGDFDGGFDYFAVELLRAGPQYPLSLYGSGFFAEGTLAAAHYVERFLAPDAGRLEQLWHVVKWTDANHDGRVGSEDTFEVVAEGR